MPEVLVDLDAFELVALVARLEAFLGTFELDTFFGVRAVTFLTLVFLVAVTATLAAFVARADAATFLLVGFAFFLLILMVAAPRLALVVRVVLAALTATEERVGITYSIQKDSTNVAVFYTEKAAQNVWTAW